MSLRARKPELEKNRFRCLAFGEAGSGKSHFCCTFPKTYYIDTEELLKYRKYVNMLSDNDSDVIQITELDEIIKEVSYLLTEKHDYSTLVIDSLTNVYLQACDAEAERLALASHGRDPEGTEFGRNTTKPKRKIMRLANILSRLDMNVIVTCHAKVSYVDGKEVGVKEDIYDKLKYILGSSMHVMTQGNKRKGRMVKSRYEELPQGELFDLSYDYFEKSFGRDVFFKESTPEELVDDEQLATLNRLFKVLHVSDEIVNKGVAKAKATKLKDLPKDKAQLWIDALLKKIEQGEE